MKCLHRKLRALQLQRTVHFDFVNKNLTANSFVQTNSNMYTKAVAAFRKSGCLHPVSPTHQRYARLYKCCTIKRIVCCSFNNAACTICCIHETIPKPAAQKRSYILFSLIVMVLRKSARIF